METNKKCLFTYIDGNYEVLALADIIIFCFRRRLRLRLREEGQEAQDREWLRLQRIGYWNHQEAQDHRAPGPGPSDETYDAQIEFKAANKKGTCEFLLREQPDHEDCERSAVGHL